MKVTLVGYKAKAKSTAVTPQECLLLLTLAAMYTPACAMWRVTFIEEDGASMVPFKGWMTKRLVGYVECKFSHC